MVEFMTLKGPCQLKVGTCHLPLQQCSHWALWPLTFNTSQKEFSVEIKDEMLCELEKLTEQAGRQFIVPVSYKQSVQIVTVSRDFMSPNSYIISYLDNTKIVINDTCFGQLRRKMKLKVKMKLLWLRHLRLLILGGIMDVISDKAMYC